jgi:hypothetical protein
MQIFLFFLSPQMRNALVTAFFLSLGRKSKKKKEHDWEKTSTSWEAYSRSTDQEILQLLCNKKAHQCLHRMEPRDPIILAHNVAPVVSRNQPHINRKFRSSVTWRSGRWIAVPKTDNSIATIDSNLAKHIGVSSQFVTLALCCNTIKSRFIN